MHLHVWRPLLSIGLGATVAAAKERWPDDVGIAHVMAQTIELVAVSALKDVAKNLGKIGGLAAEGAAQIRGAWQAPESHVTHNAVMGYGMVVLMSYPVEVACRAVAIAADRVVVPALGALQRDHEDRLKKVEPES